MPRFFAVAASVAICRLAQHESRFAPDPRARGLIPSNRSRRLLTPCALRLGGPHLTSQPLTPSVAPWVLPRDLRSRVRRFGSRLSSGVDAPHVARTPDDATRLEATPPMSPGCLPSVRSRSCDRAKPSAFPVTFARKSSHPCRPMRASASRQDSPPPRATPCDLGSPRGSPRSRGEDASLRPLQPTLDTSTREPLDFRARSLRCTDRRMLPLPPSFEESRVLPCGAGPSCDNPTPAGRALDGAPPASADPYTSLFAFRRVADPGTAFAAAPPRPGVFDHARG